VFLCRDGMGWDGMGWKRKREGESESCVSLFFFLTHFIFNFQIIFNLSSILNIKNIPPHKTTKNPILAPLTSPIPPPPTQEKKPRKENRGEDQALRNGPNAPGRISTGLGHHSHVHLVDGQRVQEVGVVGELGGGGGGGSVGKGREDLNP